MDIPSVEDRPPLLASFREIVGWDASHDFGHALVVELEQMAVRPNISGIVGDEDGQVADQRDVMV